MAQLVFAQIGPGGLQHKDAQRIADLQAFMQYPEGDIHTFAEQNTNLKHCKGFCPSELFRTENQTGCSFAHNTPKDPDIVQPGGVALCTTGGTAS